MRPPESPFLSDWVVFHADRTPDAPAIGSLTGRLSYRELADRVRALAGHLASTGVGPGSRVLLALPNTPATVVAGLALNTLGATSVEVNREWSADVLKEIAVKTTARHAVIWCRDGRTWARVLGDHRLDHVFVVHPRTSPPAARDALGATPVTHLLDDGRVERGMRSAPPLRSPALEPDQPALVLYTSGSTGAPHGVIQTFGNIDANTRSIVQYLGLTARDRALLALPLHYCYGRSVLQTHLLVGGSLFLDNRMAFVRSVMESLAAEQCTGFAGVPLTFELIRRQVDVSTIGFPRLRYLTQAGGAMAPETVAWARTAFRPAKLFVMYGQTEATARLSYLPPERAEDKVGSIGIAVPGVELKVVDEHGRELPPGEVGEIVARGANVTPGYLDEPAETATILRDGWLWTGDLAYRDGEGFLYHQGRVKEILKIGGHRVSPVEIEQVIARHPDVAEAAVVGISDDLMGEVTKALVVPRPGAAPRPADLLRLCRERLPAYQVPVMFVFVEGLPRNESGKLLRGELAARYGVR
jgi:acyl-CoA synthetase (AMP-forming)/AMP-acid ligase II